MLDEFLKQNIEKVVEGIKQDSIVGTCLGANCHCVVGYLDFLKEMCRIQNADYLEHLKYFEERIRRCQDEKTECRRNNTH